jgi:methylmalonyl-CoA/ethylmalonyl-CoA epimerase
VSETTTQPEITGIGQVGLFVADLDRAVAFYRDALGLRFLFQAPPGMAFFQCGEVRLLLGLPEGDAGAAVSPLVYFRVADIERAHRALAGRGVEFERPPHLLHRAADHELWMAVFKDTEGNTLHLMAERPVSG